MADDTSRFSPDELAAWLDRIESELQRLGAEVAAVRVLLGREPELRVAPRPQEAPLAPPPPPPPPPPTPAGWPRQDEGEGTVAPTLPPPAPPPPAPPPARPPLPPSRSLLDLARDWDLLGARGFAIAGGAVMALGIGLFFVLAANRGWIDARTRVGLGATASALVFSAGLILRGRYGEYWTPLAAVAAGIAGAYATLAAAAAQYDLVPDALALPLAGVIAAIGTAVALRWNSQLIAAIGLLGASLAPALQSLDAELTWESAAFAVIVLVGAAAVSVPRGWRDLLVATSVVVGAQVEWLLLEVDEPAGAGAIVVAASFLVVLLGIAVGLQLVHGRDELDPFALGYALVATGATYAVAGQLFEDRVERGGMLFAASAVSGAAFAALHLRRFPDLALVLGAAALALSAVGTADLFSDAVLTLAFSAQAILLAGLARRLGDVRLQAMSLAYVTLATAHVLLVDARLDYLFDEDADHLDGVLPLAAAAVAAAVCGLIPPDTYRPRTESGLLAFVGRLRVFLARQRRYLQEALLLAATALGTLAASFALAAVSFEEGHIAGTVLAAAVGALVLAVSGRLRSNSLAVAGYYWLGLVLVEAAAFDADRFAIGGWSVLAAAGGLLAGAYVHRLLSPGSSARDAVCAGAAAIAAVALPLGVDDLTDDSTVAGLALLALAAVYVALAAGVFRREGFRDVSTALWSLGLLFVLGAELVLLEAEDRTAAVVALTGGAVAVLSRPLREWRLWLAGTSVVGVALLVTVFTVTPPDQFFEASESPARGLWILLACLVALIAVAVTAEEEHQFQLRAIAGGVALYAVSLGILDVAERVSTASVETDFERGHTAVSGLWALIGLALLVAGLLRGTAAIRYGGLALFGLSLAKIFLYDLAELSSVARAFSFILVGGLLLAGGFFLQRLSDRLGPR